jgi:flagella basal body P-ring formation protein FlgA
MIKHSKKVTNMWKNITIIYIILFTTLILSVDVSARGNNSLTHDQLLKEIISYVEQEFNPDNDKNLRVVAHPLDSRIVVKKCEQPFSFSVASTRSFSRQFPVKVMCNTEKKPWKLFVQVSTSEMIEALVINQTIAKGTVVDIDMLEMKLIEINRVRDKSSTDLTSCTKPGTILLLFKYNSLNLLRKTKRPASLVINFKIGLLWSSCNDVNLLKHA